MDIESSAHVRYRGVMCSGTAECRVGVNTSMDIVSIAYVERTTLTVVIEAW